MSNKAWWGAVALAFVLFMAVFVAFTIQANAGVPHATRKPHCYKTGDKAPQVTWPEWFHLVYGMTKKEVDGLLDGQGHHQAEGPGWWWPMCGMDSDHGRVIVWFDKGQIDGAMMLTVQGGYIDKQAAKLH